MILSYTVPVKILTEKDLTARFSMDPSKIQVSQSWILDTYRFPTNIVKAKAMLLLQKKGYALVRMLFTSNAPLKISYSFDFAFILHVIL